MIELLNENNACKIFSITLVDDYGGIHEEVFAKQLAILIDQEKLLTVRSIVYLRDRWIIVFSKY